MLGMFPELVEKSLSIIVVGKLILNRELKAFNAEFMGDLFKNESKVIKVDVLSKTKFARFKVSGNKKKISISWFVMTLVAFPEFVDVK